MKSRLLIMAPLVALFGSLVVAARRCRNLFDHERGQCAGTDSQWSGSEVFGASAFDTSVATPDVSSPAGGTLTYPLLGRNVRRDSDQHADGEFQFGWFRAELRSD